MSFIAVFLGALGVRNSRRRYQTKCDLHDICEGGGIERFCGADTIYQARCAGYTCSETHIPDKSRSRIAYDFKFVGCEYIPLKLTYFSRPYGSKRLSVIASERVSGFSLCILSAQMVHLSVLRRYGALGSGIRLACHDVSPVHHSLVSL